MLLNYTNSPITFVHKDNLVRNANNRYRAESPDILRILKYIRPAGKPLYVHLQTETSEYLEDVPIEHEGLLRVDAMPEGDDILIVTRQYAEACRRLCFPTDRLRITVGAVYVPGNIYPVAATGLARIEGCLAYTMPDLFLHEQAADQIRLFSRHTLPEPQATGSVPSNY